MHGEANLAAVVNVTTSNPPAPTEPEPVVNVVAATTNSASSDISHVLPQCLMMTSKVLVRGPDGKQMVARALLDSSASMSLVSSRVAKTLQLPRTRTKVSFSGAQNTPLQEAQAITSMNLYPLSNSKPAVHVTAAVVPKVTCDLPLQGEAHVRLMPHIISLDLADPSLA